MSELCELNFEQVMDVSGGMTTSTFFGAASGIIWTGAETAALIPGGQGVSAFLGLGAGIFAGIAGIAALAGD